MPLYSSDLLFQQAKTTPPGRRIAVAIAVCLAVLLLALALRGISWLEVWTTIRQVKGVNLLAAFGMTALALLMRSLRWRNLLAAQKRLPLSDTFLATTTGYLGNTFLPARAGEVIRSVALAKRSGISAAFIFATALTERVLDAIVLIITGLVLLPGMTSFPAQQKPLLWIIAALGILVLAFLLLLPFFEQPSLRLLSRLRLPNKWNTRLEPLVTQFIAGSRAFLQPGRSIAFLLYTALIWLLDGLGAVILAGGMDLPLGLTQALFLLVSLGLASALPSTPGYVGLYQYTAETVLPLFGITRSQALAYILVLQSVFVIVVLALGLAGIFRLGLKTSPGQGQSRFPPQA